MFLQWDLKMDKIIFVILEPNELSQIVDSGSMSQIDHNAVDSGRHIKSCLTTNK